MATERAIDDYNAGPPPIPLSAATFTLVETLAALSVLGVVGTVAMSYLGSQTFLFAKNTSLNQSHGSVRSELDRVTNELQQAQSPPILTDTSGAATGVTPAAGLQFRPPHRGSVCNNLSGIPRPLGNGHERDRDPLDQCLSFGADSATGRCFAYRPAERPAHQSASCQCRGGGDRCEGQAPINHPNPCRPARSGDRLRNSPDTPPCRRLPARPAGGLHRDAVGR